MKLRVSCHAQKSVHGYACVRSFSKFVLFYGQLAVSTPAVGGAAVARSPLSHSVFARGRANALQARGSEAKEGCGENKARDDGSEGEDQGEKKDEATGAEDVEEDEDEQEGEDGGDDDDVLRVNPELSWEMSQAVAFRYAKKRTLSDVSLIATAELRDTGLVEGMLVSVTEDGREF